MDFFSLQIYIIYIFARPQRQVPGWAGWGDECPIFYFMISNSKVISRVRQCYGQDWSGMVTSDLKSYYGRQFLIINRFFFFSPFFFPASFFFGGGGFLAAERGVTEG